MPKIGGMGSSYKIASILKGAGLLPYPSSPGLYLLYRNVLDFSAQTCDN